ncbi:hypothetical protein CLAFUW4_11192 [Fulvia fulva]|nr:hypothetical protein CLAFUR4_11197 [Fulvia fulva]KAK4620702.1 hypothetical protein CLAFUR0_11202 [Fulvia fulva]WPV17559.1 hypothetical protein CLAFUW4_11192 [Fulvia fulva]WPV31944.1 hypothetical protein CLAFUW7_11188 [Fulvia fulva]
MDIASRGTSGTTQEAVGSILGCRTAKYDKREHQNQAQPPDRHHSPAPESTTIFPFPRDDIAEDNPAEEDMGMENLRFHAYGSDQHPTAGLRKAVKLKGSVYSLRNRLKSSISNMSLQTAFKDDGQDVGPQQRSKLKSPTSQLNLRTAFGRHQGSADADCGDSKGLRSALSNMSMGRAFQRKEPDFVMLPEEEVEEGQSSTPQRRKRLAMHGDDLPAGGIGLRQAVSNMSLRSSATFNRMLEGELELPTESVPSLVRKKLAKPGEAPPHDLKQSLSSIALRAGFISSEAERDDLGPRPIPVRRKRLAISVQLPPRGQVLIPPIPESPRYCTGSYQLIVKPEVMVHNGDTADLQNAGDMFVATEVSAQGPSSTVRRQDRSMDTLGEALDTTQRKDKFCDPKTLAILTGACHSTSAENHLDYQSDTSDPFVRGYYRTHHANRHLDHEDDGCNSQARTPHPTPSPSPHHRDEASSLSTSEFFAGFSAHRAAEKKFLDFTQNMAVHAVNNSEILDAGI